MSAVVPHRFMFRYSIPIARFDGLPRRARKLLNLSEEHRLPSFAQIDEQQDFADIRMAWNEKGIGISVSVSGKQRTIYHDPRDPAESDGLQVWIDTRNTQTIHRASRFCHHFCLLSQGHGKNSKEPSVIQLPIARAREESPMSEPGKFRVYAKSKKDGYDLEAWLPSKTLVGFDEATGDDDQNPLVGFYCYARDQELGEQFLSVGREFPFAQDPSLWATLELMR